MNDDDYDWRDDLHKSWLLALELVRERVKQGGPMWRPEGNEREHCNSH